METSASMDSAALWLASSPFPCTCTSSPPGLVVDLPFIPWHECCYLLCGRRSCCRAGWANWNRCVLSEAELSCLLHQPASQRLHALLSLIASRHETSCLYLCSHSSDSRAARDHLCVVCPLICVCARTHALVRNNSICWRSSSLNKAAAWRRSRRVWQLVIIIMAKSVLHGQTASRELNYALVLLWYSICRP
jgi:hypothetical protein